MKLLGLSGTNGAGKDTVAELLAKKYQFLFISVSDLLRDEATTRNLSTDRKNLRRISAEWRRKHGLGALIDKAVDLYEKKGGDETYNGLIVSSIRNPGEIDRIHDFSGQLIWIDADPKVRFARINLRSRQDDPGSFDEFQKQEAAEMKRSGDEATLSMEDVKYRADITFINNHDELTSLEADIINKFDYLND